MPASRPCENCLKVKRCAMVRDAGGRLAYVCGPCSRTLETRQSDEGGEG